MPSEEATKKILVTPGGCAAGGQEQGVLQGDQSCLAP